jgi:hypothetical protein
VVIDTPLPPGLVAELLPKLRRLHVEAVKHSHQGFEVSFTHHSQAAVVQFKIFYAAHPPPRKVQTGQLQSLRYEGNGVHVLKLAGQPPLAGTVIKVEGLTFASALTLK